MLRARRAPGLWQRGGNIIESLLAAYIRQQIQKLHQAFGGDVSPTVPRNEQIGANSDERGETEIAQ
jgi:hypothetical protein